MKRSILRRTMVALARLFGRLFALGNVLDLIALAGLGLLAYGLWIVWRPLAYVVSGALLIAFAIWRSWREATRGSGHGATDQRV